MIYRGHVQNGMVVLDNEAPLPEGVEVRVELVEPPPDEPALDERRK